MSKDLSLAALRAPPPVTAALEKLRTALTQAAGDNLVALLLYGAVARGHYRGGTSDVDLVVVLKDTSFPALRAIAPGLREAFRSVRADPLLLSTEDLTHASDVFPTKFLAIQRQRVLLAGVDPFEGLTISREHVRLRVEQELRNLSLRLRRRFVARHDDAPALQLALHSMTGSLESALHALLWLDGEPLSPASGPQEVLRAAAARFDLDGEALARLHDGQEVEGVAAHFERLCAVIDRAIQFADGWVEAGLERANGSGA